LSNNTIVTAVQLTSKIYTPIDNY